MSKTLSFLFGKEAAHKMKLLDEGLLAINDKHCAYFATITSRLILVDEAAQPASLAEFVQPWWQAGIPSLFIDPMLPALIEADCLACVQQVRAATLAAHPKP